MPSPFPGMDPFLERPPYFEDLHDSLIDAVKAHLQTVLPPPYFAAGGDRVWVDVSERSVGPDVGVVRGHDREPDRPSDGAAIATMPQTRTQPVVVLIPSEEFREPFVEIRTRIGGEERIVAAVEVLSPTNKRPGVHGRDLYLRKQRELRGARVHLVEIDLLRGGEHTSAVPVEWVESRCGDYAYHVCVSRGDEPLRHEIYAWGLREPLPEILLPLLPGDGGVTIDLQAAFVEAYARGGHARRVDYADPSRITPPLSPDDAAWATGVVAARD